MSNTALTSYLLKHWSYLTKVGQYPGIDAARALAIFMVVFFHYHWFPLGWIGVDLFFVISGFLVGGHIIDKCIDNRFSMYDFYRNRILRILPVYYLTILLCIFFKAGDKSVDTLALASIGTALFFLQTTGPYFFSELFLIDHSYIPGGSWSLAVEEIFYIFAPLLLISIFKFTKKLGNVAGILFLIASAGVLVRFFMTRNFPPNDYNLFFASFIQFHSRYDELVLGVICAISARCVHLTKSLSKVFSWISTILFIAFLAFMLLNPVYLAAPQTLARDTIWIPSLLGCLFSFFILSIYRIPIQSGFIIIIARLSYPLYLIHILIQEVAFKHSTFTKIFTAYISNHGVHILLLILSLFFSYVVSLAVEYPFINYYKSIKKNK